MRVPSRSTTKGIWSALKVFALLAESEEAEIVSAVIVRLPAEWACQRPSPHPYAKTEGPVRALLTEACKIAL
jgi:hypothetical protein